MLNDVDVEPLGRMILVEPDDAHDRKSKGGIILPDSAKNPVDGATVLAVGPGMLNDETGKRMPVDIEKDERVLIPRYCGTEFQLNGRTVRLIPAPEIVARLKAKPAAKPVPLSARLT